MVKKILMMIGVPQILLGVYARSKHKAEIFVKENAKRYLICRAGWMMGGGPKKDKKFVKKILDQLVVRAPKNFLL